LAENWSTAEVAEFKRTKDLSVGASFDIHADVWQNLRAKSHQLGRMAEFKSQFSAVEKGGRI